MRYALRSGQTDLSNTHSFHVAASTPVSGDEIVIDNGEDLRAGKLNFTGTLVDEDGSSVSLKSVPHGVSFVVTSGSVLVLDNTHPISLDHITVEEGARVIINGPVTLDSLTASSGASISFNGGLTIHHLEKVESGARVDVTGHFKVGGHTIHQTGDVSSLWPTHAITGGAIYHEKGCDPCFAAGTRIMTLDSNYAPVECVVEALKVGDMLYNPEADGRGEEIIAVGYGKAHSEDGEATGIKIKANTFRRNVPNRDLLVTPEHCIVLEGNLIPARLLVNGSTIKEVFYDFTYVHVLTKNHAIILAELCGTETLLNTHEATVMDKWEGDPNSVTHTASDRALPLLVDADKIEALMRKNNVETTFPAKEVLAPMTLVVTAPGTDLKKTFTNIDCTRKLTIDLPKGTTSLELNSTTFRPNLVGRTDDRRVLGINVGKLFFNDDDTMSVPTNLHLGWYPDGWTNGSAIVPVPRGLEAKSITIELR